MTSTTKQPPKQASKHASNQTAKPQSLIELSESVSGGNIKVDRDAGIIRDVKILGRISKNKGGREYTDTAMREAADLYEGMKVNIDHPPRSNPDQERRFSDGIGELRNVQKRDDGVYGDLHYLKSHPLAESLCEAAERFPNRFGLSHNGRGVEVPHNGKFIVESVRKMFSVDIVQNPATNRGLFESEEPEEEKPVKTTLKEYVAAIDAKHAGRAALTSLLEMDGVSPEMGGYEMEAAPAEMSADDQAIEAIVALVRAALKDGDPEKATAAIKALGKIISPGEETPADPPADDEATPTQESVDQAAAAKLKKQSQDHATELLEAAGIKPTAAQVKAVAASDSSADRKSLIESWKPKDETRGKAQKPPISRPLRESTDNPPEEKRLSGKELLSAIR